MIEELTPDAIDQELTHVDLRDTISSTIHCFTPTYSELHALTTCVSTLHSTDLLSESGSHPNVWTVRNGKRIPGHSESRWSLDTGVSLAGTGQSPLSLVTGPDSQLLYSMPRYPMDRGSNNK